MQLGCCYVPCPQWHKRNLWHASWTLSEDTTIWLPLLLSFLPPPTVPDTSLHTNDRTPASCYRPDLCVRSTWLTYVADLRGWPMCPTYVSNLHGWPTWLTYVSNLRVQPTWLTYMADLCVQPTCPTYMADLRGWPMCPTYMSNLHGWPMWLTYVSDLHVQPTWLTYMANLHVQLSDHIIYLIIYLC